MNAGLPPAAIHKVIETIAREPEVQKVILYGSRAKGTQRAGSDIDLCLDAEGLDASVLLRLENELDDLLLPWMIDITVRDRIDDPALLEHIERVGIVLYHRARSAAPRV
jgi:predicted nucleotidyltransferase